MTVQRLHPNLAAVDLITAPEINSIMASNFDSHLRDRFRGVKVMRLPIVTLTATATTTTLASSPPGQPLGPDSGYIWRLGRVTVASSGTDAGAVTLYQGSDPSQTDPRHQVDNSLLIGHAYYPGSRGVYIFPDEFLYLSAVTVIGNTYVVSGQVVEVPMEMMGKIL